MISKAIGAARMTPIKIEIRQRHITASPYL